MLSVITNTDTYIHNYCRYASRSLIIPFKLPSIGPTNEQEAAEFEKLNRAMKNVSSAVGWAISIGRELEEGQQFADDLMETVNSKLPGVDSRLKTAYTTLLFCIRKVNC